MRKFTSAFLLLLFMATGLFAQHFTYPGITGKAGMILTDSKATGVQIVNTVPAFSLDDFVVDGKPVKNINLPGTILFNETGMPNLPGKSIEVFPNPINGKFNLDITDRSIAKINIKIYNVLGNIVFVEYDFQLNGKLHKTIDISTLPKGIYHLKVESDNISVIKRIVIEK